MILYFPLEIRIPHFLLECGLGNYNIEVAYPKTMEVFNKPLHKDIMITGIMLSVLVFKSSELEKLFYLLAFVWFSGLFILTL